jgi:hypothetical protein
MAVQIFGRPHMNEEQVLKELESICRLPRLGTEDYSKSLEQNDFLQFLLDTRTGNVLLYCSFKHSFIYSVLIPSRSLKSSYVEDLMEWQSSPGDSWGYGYGFSKRGGLKHFISKPFDSNSSKILARGQPLTFLRYFEGKGDRKGYIEVSQFLTHLHDLHFMDERGAYCRINKDGDIEEVVKTLYPPEGGYITTIKQDVLDFHLFLNKSVLVRFFDRVVYDKEWGLDQKEQQRADFSDEKNEIYARRGILINQKGQAISSWIRGFQVVRNKQPRRVMLSRLTGNDLEPKKYETFICWDWKHERVAELSCAPHELGNYFVESDKPFETSPAFFKPDVLLKYKQDPEKYTLDQRHIKCRNSWHLQTYDVNEAGQVFTYLCYLGDLPHNEQLHWKQYNENPKAGISERALKTDFKAEWDLSYEPLLQLKASLEELSRSKSELWTCRDSSLNTQLNYVVSDSVKEWADEIQTLDKLVVEGFNHQYLKGLSQLLDCYDHTLGSVKLLGAILKAKAISSAEIEQIIAPLEEIQLLRTRFSAHVSGTAEKDQIRKNIITEHGTLKRHFRDLVEKTDKGIKILLELNIK